MPEPLPPTPKEPLKASTDDARLEEPWSRQDKITGLVLAGLIGVVAASFATNHFNFGPTNKGQKKEVTAPPLDCLHEQLLEIRENLINETRFRAEVVKLRSKNDFIEA